MRAAGSGELDLDFTVDSVAARSLGVLPSPSDQGLVALAKAVSRGASNVSVTGDNERCLLQYDSIQIPLGPGALTTILRRGNMAPLQLSVNGLRLVPAAARPLSETRLQPEGAVLGGCLALLPGHQRGQVVLIDRGVSFRLGALFGATRVIAEVTPRRGRPWPSNLTLDSSLKQILEYLLKCCQALENSAAQELSEKPQLLGRLLSSVQQRRRLGDQAGAAQLLGSILQNGGQIRKVSG